MCQPSRLPAQALYRLLLLPLPAAHTSSSSVHTGCRLEPKAVLSPGAYGAQLESPLRALAGRGSREGLLAPWKGGARF